MMQLQISTYLAENTNEATRVIAKHLSETLSWKVYFDDGLSFEKRLALIKSGEIALTWLCGLLYVRLRSKGTPLIPLLAPVFGYGADSRPVYYSFLLGLKAARMSSFDDLRGKRLAINERSSFSGYEVLRYAYLQEQKQPAFSEILVSGSHKASLALLLEGKADIAAIDYSLYCFLAKRQPELASKLDIVKTLGPFPAPPIVVHQSLEPKLRLELTQALLAIPSALLESLDLKAFRQVDDKYYKPIREVAKQASKVRL